MAVDGTTTLGGLTSAGSDLTDPGWGPGQFQAYQLRDYLDFRAVYPGENRSILRLWSNLEAHLYGELILHDGAIRSFNTMSIACVTDDQDLVSFRSGTNTGQQVARITRYGNYQIFDSGLSTELSSANVRFYNHGTIKAATAGNTPRSITMDGTQIILNTGNYQWGFFEFATTPNIAKLKAFSDATTSQALSIYFSKIAFCSDDATDLASFVATGTQVSLVGVDGSYKIFTGGQLISKLGIAELRFYNDCTIKSLTAGGTPHTATIEAGDVYLKLGAAGSSATWGRFYTSSGVRKLTIADTSARDLQIDADKLIFYDNGVNATWGSLYVSSSVSYLYSDLPLTIHANSGSWQDIILVGANLSFTTKGSGSLSVVDNSGDTRMDVDQEATLTLTSSASHSANVVLDSETDAGAKTWVLESDYSSDELKFVNVTDSVTVRVTPTGSVYAPEHLGTGIFVVSGGIPSSTLGDPGAIFIESGGAKLWVKTGSGTWKYAVLN